MKIFVDTNIVADLVLQREPFYDAACKLFALASNNICEIYIAPITISTLSYLLERKLKSNMARNILINLSELVKITTLDDKIVRSSIADYLFNDIEDSMQYHSGLGHQCKCIITRNGKDYIGSNIPVYTPDDFFEKNGYVFENE